MSYKGSNEPWLHAMAGYNDVRDDPAMGWARYAHSMRVFVMNSGLFYMRPTRASVALLDRIVHRLNTEDGWDQAIFNEVRYWLLLATNYCNPVFQGTFSVSSSQLLAVRLLLRAPAIVWISYLSATAVISQRRCNSVKRGSDQTWNACTSFANCRCDAAGYFLPLTPRLHRPRGHAAHNGLHAVYELQNSLPPGMLQCNYIDSIVALLSCRLEAEAELCSSPSNDMTQSFLALMTMHTSLLLCQVRHDARYESLRPVMIHVNYHPDKHARMLAVVDYYINNRKSALQPFPDGSE